MAQSSVVRWILVAILVLAIIGLLAYARGPRDSFRRTHRGQLGAPALVRGLPV
jgi:hypothetical protein